jgi:UrcA family protein
MFVTLLNANTHFFISILTVLGGVAPATGRAADAEEGAKPRVATETVIAGGKSVKVRYHDLNLKTDTGVTAHYHPIKFAAHTVCDRSVPVWASQRGNRLQGCLGSAVGAAVAQLGNAGLAAVHRNAASAEKPVERSLF